MKPKHAFVPFILICLVIIAGCSRSPEPTFTISGKIANYKSGSLVLTREENLNRRENSVVATIPVDKSGVFSMPFDLEPHLYKLSFYGKKSVDLAIDRGQNVIIQANANDLSSITVTGSEDTAKLEAYEKFRKESLDRLVISVRNQIANLGGANDSANDSELARLGDLEIVNYDKHKDELIGFVKENMADSIAAYATTIRWDGAQNIPSLEFIAAAFAAKHPNLAVTERIREKVDLIKRNNIGGIVSEIKMPVMDGRSVPLSSIGAKYILVDFWASWCPPCRRESPELTALYDKYKSRGFEIYGVSLDSERDAWIGAMRSDKRIWPNVSTLQEYDTPAAFDYSITALPASFLIDSDRKVIARNLHGTELRTKLESLFGE